MKDINIRNGDLSETIDIMCSTNSTNQLIAEYIQTAIRYEKLKSLCHQIELAEDFEDEFPMPQHGSPLGLLQDQLYYMEQYLNVLEKRAIAEGVKLA